MIRYTWADVVPTDKALHRGEWAGVRASTADERKTALAGRHDVCMTFVFRGCGHVLRLVIHQAIPQRSLLQRLTMERRMIAAVGNTDLAVPQPYSTAVFATALALAPGAELDMDKARRALRCGDCHCVMRADGPLDADSTLDSFIRELVYASSASKRSA